MKLFFSVLVYFSSFLNAHSQDQPIEAQPALEALIDFQKVRDFTISNDGNEAYITIQTPLEEVSHIAKIVKQNGQWQDPELVSFTTEFKELEPFLSPDNLRLYFVSNRPLDRETLEAKDFDIYYVERKTLADDWSTPINLGLPVNTQANEFYPAVSSNGNMYFTSDAEGGHGRDDIYFSPKINDTFGPVQNLGDHINTDGFEFNAYVSRDESYLIFSGYNREDGLGSGDLYIIHKNENGEWTQAVVLTQHINSPYMDYCPFVDENNNIIYFTSRRSSISPKTPITSSHQLLEMSQQYENGNSRIYMAEWK